MERCLDTAVDPSARHPARFINLINNEPTIRTLLPLSPTGMEDPEDETFKLTTEDGKLKACPQCLALATNCYCEHGNCQAHLVIASGSMVHPAVCRAAQVEREKVKAAKAKEIEAPDQPIPEDHQW
eukprot:Skav212781  [mRNA]  locus=scaffold159:246051:246758:- [translate_table: standard]